MGEEKTTMTNSEREKCTDGNCNCCNIAEHEQQIALRENEINEYTVFEKQIKIKDLLLQVNLHTIIAKTDLAGGQTFIKYFSLNPLSYCFDNLKQYAVQLRKLRKYNNLCIPDEICGKKDYPAAFRWGDIWYLIAPRIDDPTPFDW